MKTLLSIVLIVIFLGSITAQSSTLWVKREKKFVGGACPVQMKIGNQSTITMENGKLLKYNLTSIGKIKIYAELLCPGDGMQNRKDISIKVEPGKEYFVLIRHGKAEFLYVIDDPKETEEWKKGSFQTAEEDKDDPINKKSE